MALSQSRGKPSETVATASLNARAEVNGMSPAVAKALDDAGYDVGRFIGKGMAQLVGCRSTGLHLTRVLGLCACGVSQRNPTPGSPASKLPERARRASFASMQRRSSVSSISEANLP